MSAFTVPDRIPATIITGFLGAGKTTLIRHLIANAEGRRIALIVNEFGEVGFDGTLLADCSSDGCAAEEIVELANGCICCTVADDFLPTMEALLDRAEPPDAILIETSGLALPQPLVKAFSWNTIRDRVTVDGVVTVVDAAAVAAGDVAADEGMVAAQRAQDPALDHESPIEELFEDQLRCADLIVVSKADLVDSRALRRVEDVVASERRPAARLVAATMGRLPASVVMGIGAAAEDDRSSRLSHHERNGEDDHEHDDFTSFLVTAAKFGDQQAARDAITRAMAVDGVLRIKGRVSLEASSSMLMIQAVGPRIESWFVPPDEYSPEAQLVVIGLADMDQAAVEQALGA